MPLSKAQNSEREHNRRSIRLRGYDYGQEGAYFVTLMTQGRARLFGRIVRGTMLLSPVGQVVADSWEWLARQYPYVQLDEWVVMPDHFHGILVISDPDIRGSPAAARDSRKSLGRLVGAFKTISSKRIREIGTMVGARLWQRNYYERIIRDERALLNIRRYIRDNPRAGPSPRRHGRGQRGSVGARDGRLRP